MTLPAVKTCSYFDGVWRCEQPAVGWFWSKTQGYTGWCIEHVDRQSIEVNAESFR